jgi:hypothetical protein
MVENEDYGGFKWDIVLSSSLEEIPGDASWNSSEISKMKIMKLIECESKHRSWFSDVNIQLLLDFRFFHNLIGVYFYGCFWSWTILSEEISTNSQIASNITSLCHWLLFPRRIHHSCEDWFSQQILPEFFSLFSREGHALIAKQRRRHKSVLKDPFLSRIPRKIVTSFSLMNLTVEHWPTQ